MSEDSANHDDIEPIWAISARIIEERPYGPGGHVIKRGTQKFRANQKVYIQFTFSRNTGVIGRYRGKFKYISSIVRTEHLSDFRVELVYSPTIIKRLKYGYGYEDRHSLTEDDIAKAKIPKDGSSESKRKAEVLVEWFNSKL